MSVAQNVLAALYVKPTLPSTCIKNSKIRWKALLLNASWRALKKQRLHMQAADFSLRFLLRFLYTMLSDTCRLTLTDWLRLWGTTKGCEPVKVGMCDCNCLSMRLCGDKSTDVYQIDRAFSSIKALGFQSLIACHSRFHHTWFKWCWFLRFHIMWKSHKFNDHNLNPC